MKRCISIYDGTFTEEDFDEDILATDEHDGLMSKEDKIKLDSISISDDGEISKVIDYENSINKPKINNIELVGNKTLKELKIQEFIANIKDDKIVFTKPIDISETKLNYNNIINAPTKLSEFINDLNFQTNEDVNEIINSLEIFIQVDKLPEVGVPNKIYMLLENEKYIAYIFINDKWEPLTGQSTGSIDNINAIPNETLTEIFNRVNN